MALLTGIGFSTNSNPVEAVNEAYKSASIEGHKPSLTIIYMAPTFYNQQDVLSAYRDLHTDSLVVGCSTSGEITSKGGSLDNSLALMTIFSDKIKFVAGVGKNVKESAREAGKRLAEDIKNNAGGESPKLIVIFADALAGNGADIVRGILDVHGEDFPVIGGSAGDDYNFKQTYEYFGDQVLSGDVVGIGLYGDFSYGIGVRHGWLPIGIPHVATKAKECILYELDGKPAIQFYEESFSKEKNPVNSGEPLAKYAIMYPLGITSPNKDGYLVRAPISALPDGSISFAAEIPEGSEVHLMIGSRDEAIEAAEDAAKIAFSKVSGKEVKAVLVFDCIARKKMLMLKKQEEIDKIQNVFGANVPLIGFYTYGEQAPLGEDVSVSSFHNETVVVLALAE